MVKCEKCGFEAKNASGLRLHMKKHRNDTEPEVKENIGRETGIAIDEKPSDNFTAPIRVRLFDSNDELVLEYPVFGAKALEDAKENAKSRGYKIEIRQTIIE